MYPAVVLMFYNPKCRHGYAGGISPAKFEQQYFNRLESVQESRGDSLGVALLIVVRIGGRMYPRLIT